jgi:DNA polymerase III epsilon subunit-like protein
MSNYIYLDTEYSSFFSADRNKSGDLLQLSCVAIVDGVEAGRFDEKCKPLGKNWNAHAEKVHGISANQAKTFQDPKVLAGKFKKFLESFDTRFICAGWNCDGDKKYVERLIADYEMIMDWHLMVKPKWRDVLTRAKKRKKSIPTKNMKLQTVCDFFGVNIDAHDALSDAIATWKVDEYLNSIIDDTVTGKQTVIQKMSEIEKRKKYLDSKYFMINGEGSVYISEHCTANPEALRVVMQELWDLYVEKE